MGPAHRQHLCDARQVFWAQCQLRALHQFAEMRHRPGAGNGQHMRPLRQKPCNGQSSGGLAHIGRQRAEFIGLGNIGGQIGRLKPRVALQKRHLGQARGGHGPVGQQGAPHWRKRHQCGAQFGAGLHQAQFGKPRGQRIFRLHSCHRVHRMGPPQRAGGDF